MEQINSAELFGDDFGGERMWGLREIAVPDSVSLVPQTIGWTLLSLLLFALLLIYCWRRYQYWQQQAFRRNALTLLAHMRNHPSRIQRLPALIRHVALNTYTREDVVGLRGEAWIEWLNDKAGLPLFCHADIEILNRLAYSDQIDLEVEKSQSLIDASERWVVTARV
jgi:hypothetical protein